MRVVMNDLMVTYWKQLGRSHCLLYSTCPGICCMCCVWPPSGPCPSPCPSAGMLRVRFVPEMVGSFLQVSLLPQKGAVTTHTYTHAHHICTVHMHAHTRTGRQTDMRIVFVVAAFSCCSFEAENYPPVLWHDGVTFTWERWLPSGKHVHSLPHMPDFWQQNRGSVSSTFLLFLSSSCALQ